MLLAPPASLPRPSSLLRCVAAFSSRHDAWLQTATALLSQYAIDPAAALLMTKPQLASSLYLSVPVGYGELTRAAVHVRGRAGA
jgi:hypothetical protein